MVLSGSELQNEALRESVASHWDLSPYEFCSFEEFNALKTNPNYYFLLIVKERFRKESDPCINVLTLVKGGSGAGKSIDDMLEVVSFPLCSSDAPSGRELILLPAFLEIIQDHTAGLTDTELKAYSGLGNYNKHIRALKNRRIHFCEEDLAPQIGRKLTGSLDEDILLEDEDTVDEVFSRGTFNAVVSYVVAPEDPVNGSVCYKMLIGADTHELYYFKKHRISARRGKGFLASDLKAIEGVRKR